MADPHHDIRPADPVPQGGISYGSYLKIPELLTLQSELSTHRDELLFIVSHQVYELWFKQMLHELKGICQYLDQNRPLPACQLFTRIHVIQHLLIEQIPLLETMFSVDFAKFRDNLRPASGFQSIQFRLVEFLSGHKNPKMMGLVGEDDVVGRKRMEAAIAAPTVFDHLLRCLDRLGFKMPADVLNRDITQPYTGDSRVVDAILPIYQDNERQYPVFRLCEHFLEYDERLSLWRFHHVKMVERMIGSLSGTGGSSGAKYLQSTVSNRLFADLWSIRDRLGPGGTAPAGYGSGGGCPMGHS